MAGILGNISQNSILGDTERPRIPWGSNPVVSMIGASLLGAPTLQQGFQNVGRNLPAGMALKAGMQDDIVKRREAAAETARTRAAWNAGLKMKSGLSLTPEEQAALSAAPEIAFKFMPEQQDLKTVGNRLYDPNTKSWIEPPGGAGGGPYEGTSMDAQNWNIVLNGDPAAPEYEAAYTQLFAPRTVPSVDVQGNQVLVPLTPPIPPNVRRPGKSTSVMPQRPTQSPPAPDATQQVTQKDGGMIPGVGDPIVIGNPKPSDTQMSSALYADRMTKSNDIITKLEQAGTSYVDAAASGVPFGIGNYLVSDDYRQLDQAERDFVNATLRRESGAAISLSEFDNARKQYFPQPGDDQTTIEQKRANRQTAIEGIARAAGPSYKPPAPGGTPGGGTLTPGAAYIWSPDGTLRPAQ